MKAVVLAAGEGSRMRPLTSSRPKVMIPVANRPILEHLLVEMKKAGIKEFIIVVGYHDEQIRDYFTDGSPWGISIEYCRQGRRQGTADALKMVSGLTEGKFLLVNGDNVIGRRDIERVMANDGHTMSVVEVEDPVGLGVVEVSGGKVLRIHEKVEHPPSRMVNAGLYHLGSDIFRALSRTVKSRRGEYELTDSLQLLIDCGEAIRYEEIGFWLNLSYPWDLLAANQLLLADMECYNEGKLEENVAIKGKVSIGRDTVIRSGTYIDGPAIIGENCDIGPNCHIRPFAAIGDGCHIGNASEVKASIIMNGTMVPHHNYVGDSVIGSNCNLGSGAKIANLRLDKGNIRVDGIDTGRRKLGAIIGDGVEVGINASINTGTIIGNDARIAPGAVVCGVVRPGARIS